MENVCRIITIKQVYSNYLKDKEYIPSGFNQLDKVTKGFKRKEVTIIGGRPGTGKTSFGVSFCSNIIIRHFSILYVTLELSAVQLFDRFHIQNSQKVNESIINSNFFICDSHFTPDNFSLLEISIRKLNKEKNLDIVFIDYVQLIFNDQIENRSTILKLKNLAKELNLALVIFSQLSKNVDERINEVPLLDDLLCINGNDENIDNVFLILRNKGHKANKINLSVAKHNEFQGETISFEYDNSSTIIR